MSARRRHPSPQPRRGPMARPEPYAESFSSAEEDPRAALLCGLVLSGCRQTGLLSLGDHGVPPDATRAASFLQQAAASALSEGDKATAGSALYHNAMLLEQGEERTMLLQRAAGVGHPEACFILGSASSTPEGDRLLRIAASDGHPEAQLALGLRLIPHDKENGVRLLLSASLYGVCEADWELFLLYRLQPDGITHLRLPPPPASATGEQEAAARLRRASVAGVEPAMLEMAAQLSSAGRQEEARKLLHRVLWRGGAAAAAAAAALAVEHAPS